MAHSTTILLATTILASATAVSAWAQTSAPAPATPPATTQAPAAQSTTLQEVVVTAQRRSENVQKAALAIDAVSSQKLTANGITDVASITQLVPSVQIGKAAGPYVVFYVRGVGSNASNSLTDAAVSVSLDGVPLARQYDTVGQIFDLARVEVLEGPQGTLYGRNASAGAVNIIPNHPNHTYSSDVGLTVGDYSTFITSGDVNIPINDVLATRVSFQTSNHTGYLSDGEADEDIQSARVQLLYTPTQDLSLLIAGSVVGQGGTGGGPAIVGKLGNQTFTLDQRIGLGDPRVVALETGNTPVFPVSDMFLKGLYTNIKAELTWTNPLGALTVIPAYVDNHIHFGADYGGDETDNEFDHQASVEARFTSKDTGPVRWIVGGYYMHDGLSALFTLLNNKTAGPAIQNYNYATDAKAVFGDATVHLTDKFRLIGGVRYTDETKTFVGTDVNPQTPAANLAIDASKDFTGVTYRAGAQYDIVPTSMVYAMVSTGFHSGGFFFTDPQDNPSFNPESITAYTLGSKNTFFSGRLRANIEFYDWQYKNQQLGHSEINASGQQVFATQNAGATRMRGVEATTLFKLTETTQIGMDVQYLDAVFTQYLYDQPSAGSALSKCATGLSGNANPALKYFVSCQGLAPPNAPRWIFSPSFDQDFPLPNGGNIRFDATAHYQSQTWLSVSYQPTDVQPSYFTGNMSLTYSTPNRRWSISAFVDNVANSVIGEFAAHTNFNNVQLEPPRTYGVRLAGHFS